MIEKIIEDLGWIKILDYPLYYRKEGNNIKLVIPINFKDLNIYKDYYDSGKCNLGAFMEMISNHLKYMSDTLMFPPENFTFEIILDSLASHYFGVDGDLFSKYSKQFKQLTGREWNAGFVKR